MALQKWSRPKPLNNPIVIKQLEEKYGFTLSDDLVNCILSNNGARPRPNTIELKNGEENDVKLLLSYNDSDPENIFKVIEYFVNTYNGTLIPLQQIQQAITTANREDEQSFGHRIKKFSLYVIASLQFLDSLYELE